MSTRTGTHHFVSLEKAINYYSRMTPASSRRDIRQETEYKLANGEICVGAPSIKPGERLLVIDNGTRYAIESIEP